MYGCSPSEVEEFPYGDTLSSQNFFREYIGYFTYADILISAGLYGLYITIFFVAIGAASSSGTIVPRKIRAAMWITLCLSTVHTVLLLGPMAYVMAGLVPEQCSLGSDDAVRFFIITHSTAELVLVYIYPFSIFVTPIVGLLSESILAWRCYIIWGKKLWTKWILIVLLISVAGTGVTASAIIITGAITATENEEATRLMNKSYETLTLAWPWSVLVLNTALTLSIVLKIWLSGRYIRSSRVSYAARLIVESSMITWIATLIYAAANTRSSGEIPIINSDIMNLQYSVRTQLPLVFAISQSLIVARVGIMRFKTAGEAATTITGFRNVRVD